MKQARIHLSLLLFAVLSVTVLAAAPVSARHASAESAETSSQTASESDSTTGTSSDDSSSAEDTTDDTTTTTPQHNRGMSADKLAELKANAKAHVAELRQDKPDTSVAKRQKLCQNRKKAVDNKVKAFGNAADKHLTKLDDVFTKLQDYQKEKQLSVANYQELVDAATAKQLAATTAVNALQSVTVDIDCTSTDPASSLTVVKDAAKEARTSLQDYRTSLKNIVVALAQAKDASSDTTTDSTGGNE